MAKGAANKYSDTLNLPQTDYPMRAGLPKREPEWLTQWHQENMYHTLRAKRAESNNGKFILHLGPPYANGHMHMGHALSYVLKDFIVRSKFMQGMDAPFVPGWDCHGLPIEWKVEEGIRESGKSKHDFSIKDLRDKCRAYAKKWIDIQASEWQRFGCIGDWENPYLTMNPKNEANIVRELGKMVQNGLVYKGLKSTLWSTVEETALAEAEIEYADKKSTAIYVKFALKGEDKQFIIIWTTTPWTLPSNRAIAYKNDADYVALKVEKAVDDSLAMAGETYWVAGELQADFIRSVGVEEFATVGLKKGVEFAGMDTQHPFYSRTAPLLEGFHVTTESGTGFVHIAPAHGQEDFQIGCESNLELHCPVLEDGTYDKTVDNLPDGTVLTGQSIWSMQKAIVANMLSDGSLLKAYDFTHSYPVSWRSKAPLIFRATTQWFVSMDNDKRLRDNSLNAIDTVTWVPAYGRNRIYGMIEKRPDWCISRQRAWGVPITILTNTETDEVIADPAVWEYIANLIEQHGIDVWEQSSVEDLLPAGWLKAHGVKAEDIKKERDILDVWFDSGTTHAHVLRADAHAGGRFERHDNKRPADLYLEGSDQHRGWFHSSLLTSVANYGDAPYEQVLTHGFVVDGEGRKFSKSLGNGVEPRTLLDKYGMDIVRLWVAASDYSEDIRYSDEIMQGMADAYRRFRNTFRFLLGNLADFDATQHSVELHDLPRMEQYIMRELHALSEDVVNAYNSYKFHSVFRKLLDFCNMELSNRYFDIRKDVLYCDAKDSKRRRSVQTVLSHIFNVIVTHIAPILVFTADETWRARYGEVTSVHLVEFAPLPKEAGALSTDGLAEAFSIRDAVNEQREKLRASGEVGHDYEVAVTVGVCDKGQRLFDEAAAAELLMVSQVTFTPWDDVGERPVKVEKVSGHKCPRCWTYHDTLVGEVCARCDEALRTDGHKVAA